MVNSVEFFERKSYIYVKYDHLSLAGNADVIIKARGLNPVPEKNIVKFRCFDESESDLGTFFGPLLSGDNVANSNTAMGELGYTIPSVKDLLGVPDTYLIDYLSCMLDVVTLSDEGEEETLSCNSYDCKIYWKEANTPDLLRVVPQVTFKGQ